MLAEMEEKMFTIPDIDMVATGRNIMRLLLLTEMQARRLALELKDQRPFEGDWINDGRFKIENWREEV